MCALHCQEACLIMAADLRWFFAVPQLPAWTPFFSQNLTPYAQHNS